MASNSSSRDGPKCFPHNNIRQFKPLWGHEFQHLSKVISKARMVVRMGARMGARMVCREFAQGKTNKCEMSSGYRRLFDEEDSSMRATLLS